MHTSIIIPGSANGVFLRPEYIDQRYLNQATVLHISQTPFEEVKLDYHRKLDIPKELKRSIQNELRLMGVGPSFIYPGLEGVEKDVHRHVLMGSDKN